MSLLGNDLGPIIKEPGVSTNNFQIMDVLIPGGEAAISGTEVPLNLRKSLSDM